MLTRRLNVQNKMLRSSWYNPERQRQFLVELGAKLGYTNHSDWYKISKKDIRENGGRPLLNIFGSASELVMKVMCDEAWLPWLFHRKMNWTQSRSYRARYMEYLFENLGLKTKEDWYTISTESFLANHGATLLAKYGNSPAGAVMGVITDHEWQFWKFQVVPRSSWENPNNQQQFVKYLGSKLGFSDVADWYNVTANDIEAHGGTTLLKIHENSPAKLVMHTMPHHSWLPWKFHSFPPSRIKEEPYLGLYLKHMAKEYGIESLDEWYRVPRYKMAQNESYFSDIDEFAARLQSVYPSHEWVRGKFLHFSRNSVQTMLKQLLEKKYPGLEVIENYYHSSLQFEGTGEVMSVDIFIPSLRLAFEYNGEQHYKSRGFPSHFRAASTRKAVDGAKRDFFEKMGYTFVVVPCWWDGSLESLAINVPFAGDLRRS